MPIHTYTKRCKTRHVVCSNDVALAIAQPLLSLTVALLGVACPVDLPSAGSIREQTRIPREHLADFVSHLLQRSVQAEAIDQLSVDVVPSGPLFRVSFMCSETTDAGVLRQPWRLHLVNETHGSLWEMVQTFASRKKSNKPATEFETERLRAKLGLNRL